MAGLVLSMFVSLDGYTAGPSGELDWFNELDDQELDAHMATAVGGFSGLVLGRATYDMFSGYWPSVDTKAEGTEAKIARHLNELPKHVVTSRADGLDWGPATQLNGDLAGEVSTVKRETEGDLVLFGGARTAQSLMKLDLIDEYRLLVCPVVLGEGQSLFGTSKPERNLTFIDATSFERSGVTVLRYRQP
jgi:dihydrofolate reductase